MSAKVLREWLSEVLPIRAGALYVQLGGDDEVECTASGDLATTIGLAVLGDDEAIASYTEASVSFAHREDLDLPDRTRSFLRAWAKHVALDHEGCDVDRALSLRPFDVAPHRSVLEDLANESEDDFLVALGDRRLWDSSPDVTPPPLDISDHTHAVPIARSPEHERTIEEADFADEAFLAYARWLEDHGDPRGAVGVFERTGTRMGERRAARVIATHERYFYGPFPSNDWDPHVLGGIVELGLRMGWVDAAFVRLGGEGEGEKLDAILSSLLRLPGARFLRELEIAPPEYAAADEPVEEVLMPLLASGGHPTLRVLVLPREAFPEDASREAIVKKLRPSFPRLSSLILRDPAD